MFFELLLSSVADTLLSILTLLRDTPLLNKMEERGDDKKGCTEVQPLRDYFLERGVNSIY